MKLKTAMALATGVKIDYTERTVSLITRQGDDLFVLRVEDRAELHKVAGEWDLKVKAAVAARRVAKPWG